MKAKYKNKIPSIHFDGFNEDKRRSGSSKDKVISKRLIVLLVMIVGLAGVLGFRLADIQLNQADVYAVKLEEYGTDIYRQDAMRGEMVDRTGNKMVKNTGVNSAMYYATANITDEEIEASVDFLVAHIKIDNSSVDERQKKDFFMLAREDYVDTLVSEEELEAAKNEEDSEEYLTNLKLERITPEMMSQEMDETLLSKTKLTFLIKNCLTGSTTLIENISIEEASIIGANGSVLKGIQVEKDWTREYVHGNDFKRILGDVSTKKAGIPADRKEELQALDYANNARVGTSGLEQQYEELLRGTDSSYTLSYDENGNPVKTIVNSGENGSTLKLSIDWDLQAYADQIITEELTTNAHKTGNEMFNKLFLILMDPNNGDVIVMSGKEYDRETGEVYDLAWGNYGDLGLIGSTTKGGTIYCGYKNGLVYPGRVIHDTPIYIQGTKEKHSWDNLGYINDLDALARSSNVYMFTIAMELGGAHYVPNQPIDIKNEAYDIYRRDVGELGLGVKTGLDVPDEETVYRGPIEDPGKFLDLSIGQYDTYTNIQLAQYVSTIANQGLRIQPRLVTEAYKWDAEGNKVITYENPVTILDDVSEHEVAFDRIRQGFRQCVSRSDGLCSTWNNMDYITYAKTGTAEIFGTDNVDRPNRLTVGWTEKIEGQPDVVFAAFSIQQNWNSTGKTSTDRLGQEVINRYYQKYPKQ